MRTCPKCGDLNSPDANYCHGCGAPQVERSAITVEWRVGGRGNRDRRCTYCGRACYGVRCVAHADLPLPDEIPA